MIKKITEIVDFFFEDPTYVDYYLVEVKVNKHSSKVEVYIDGDQGVSFGICRKVSRAIEAHLDESNYNDGKYTLDVSSPGLSNPLRMNRQYVKNIGREIKVDTITGEVVKGELRSVDAGKIVIFTSKKKKKELIEKDIELLFEEIKTAKILTKI